MAEGFINSCDVYLEKMIEGAEWLCYLDEGQPDLVLLVLDSVLESGDRIIQGELAKNIRSCVKKFWKIAQQRQSCVKRLKTFDLRRDGEFCKIYILQLL